MAKRLFMTSADYLAIAVSPALIMALVGSLVFFLLDVMYVGDYQGRLTYVFALYVFATVLVSRIAIEDGRDYAALFAIPLGLATLAVLTKFMEHASGWNYLTNIALVLVVWWCADKLTWDCTLIDDDEDASGEGLLQRVGIDDEAEESQSFGASSNELFDKPKETASQVPWWQFWSRRKKEGHTPGLWVLYFSLAALPLFGVGQYWVPPSDVGRRRYVFGLLIVYVAAALSLLVTTSFLGLRRYLRQRRIEMPNPMAATWVAVGGVLIAIVMFIAALIPRPNAEYAISQVPWQAHSPAGLSSSQAPIGDDAPKDEEQPADPGHVVDENGPKGDAQKPGENGEPSSEGQPTQDAGQEKSEQKLQSKTAKPTNDDSGKTGDTKQSDQQQGPEQSQSQSQAKPEEKSSKSGEPSESSGESKREENGKQGKSQEGKQQSDSNESESGSEEGQKSSKEPQEASSRAVPPQHSSTPRSVPKLPDISSVLGGLSGLFKLLLYIAGAGLLLYLAWKYRRELLAAIRDILQQLRDLLARLFGGRPAATAADEDKPKAAAARRRSFTDFRNPFATGEFNRLPPEELVRYTFDAFEAWAGDGGYLRSADQTPAELVRLVAPPGTAIHSEARHMLQVYSEVAYSASTIEPAAAHSLREFWGILSSSTPPIPEKAMANAAP